MPYLSYIIEEGDYVRCDRNCAYYKVIDLSRTLRWWGRGGILLKCTKCDRFIKDIPETIFNDCQFYDKDDD
jgi:hypothetical protein